MVQLGQKTVKKWPGRVALAELVLAELTGNRLNWLNKQFQSSYAPKLFILSALYSSKAQ